MLLEAVLTVAAAWVDLPRLPTPRQEVGVAALEEKIYVVGGILPDRTPTGAVERFDPEANRWETVAPLPGGTALHHVGVAAAAGRLYAVGGLDARFRGVRFTFAYDPREDRWERVADLPAPRGAMGVASIDGFIYAAGGQDGSRTLDDFAVYDPDRDRWTELPPLPTARNHLAAVALEGRFWAIGGRSGSLLGAVEVFDPAKGAWSERAPLPTPRGGLAAQAACGLIFAFGGEGNPARPDGIFPHVEVYDPARDRWTRLEDMPHPRHGIGAAVAGNRIHIPGGSPRQGFGTTDVHDAIEVSVFEEHAAFRRGDANGDEAVDISDAVRILLALFRGGPGLRCADAADVNDDGTVDVSDPIALLAYLFQGGAPPPPPGVEALGPDPTKDTLGCRRLACR